LNSLLLLSTIPSESHLLLLALNSGWGHHHYRRNRESRRQRTKKIGTVGSGFFTLTWNWFKFVSLSWFVLHNRPCGLICPPEPQGCFILN